MPGRAYVGRALHERPRARQRDQCRDRFCRHGWMNDKDIGRRGYQRQCGKVAQWIQRIFVVQQRMYGGLIGRAEQRVAVGRGLGDNFGGYFSTCASARFDDDLLSQRFGKLFRNHARHEIGKPARNESDHQTHGLRRVGRLRVRCHRGECQRQCHATCEDEQNAMICRYGLIHF